MKKRKTFRLKLANAAALCTWAATSALYLQASSAIAQPIYPAKQLKIIVGFGPGSGLDIIARSYAELLARQMNVPVIVENREGAAGVIGYSTAARAKADGHTLLLVTNPSFAITAWLSARPRYSPVGDFEAVARIAELPVLLVANKAAPFKTFDDLVAYSKKHPGTLDYASAGIGTPSHLYFEQIKQRLGLDIQAVPYKSTAQAMTDLIGGQVPLYMPSAPSALPPIQSGQIRALAIGSTQRFPQLPEVPTLAEAIDQPDFSATYWYGFFAPKGTPQASIDKLALEILSATDTAEIRAMLAKIGAQPSKAGPAEFTHQVLRDTEAGKKYAESLPPSSR